MYSGQSGSESRTMAGKRSPPSPSREYMPLSTLRSGHPGPGTIDESWGDRVSNRACHKEQKTVNTYNTFRRYWLLLRTECTDFLIISTIQHIIQVFSLKANNSHLLNVSLLLQQCHPHSQILQFSELCLWCVGYSQGQGCHYPIAPHTICPSGAKTTSLWPPSIPCFPLWRKIWLFLEREREQPYTKTFFCSAASALNS